MQEPIWLSSPHMSGEEMKYIESAFEKNHVFPLGPNVNGFEQDIKDFTGTPNCTCLSAGTAAIHLALIMLGVEAGDEVICSSFTFSASANPIAYQGATPVFVDSEEMTWNMDPELLEKAIQDRIANGKKPKAIVMVHLYGMPAQIDRILEVAAKHEIPVVEDAAEALGSTYKGKALGTFGEIGIYSFNGNKIITTSGGGALVSDNEEYCKKALYLSTQARQPRPYYHHTDIGYNYRMSNISAGIGRGQMEVLNDRVEKRRSINAFYQKELKSIEGLSFLEEPSEDYFSNFWLTTILIDPTKSKNGITADELRLKLDEKRIESRLLWKPMHMQPIFENCPSYENGTSEKLFAQGLCLPSSSNISDDDLKMVVNELRALLVD